MIVDTNLPQKEIVEIETKLGGEYNVESVINDDGTQTLNITTAEKAVDRLQWKCDNIKSLAYEFYDYNSDAESVANVLSGIDTSQVTNVKYMFAQYSGGNKGPQTVPLFDTSNVTNMSYMFQYCGNLTEVPLFNTSNVTNMSTIFKGCTGLTEVPLFNTSNATGMGAMFEGCTSLITVPLFDTSKSTSAYHMFYNCTSLTSVPQFDMSKSNSYDSMFYGCTSLTSVPQFKLYPGSQSTSYSNMFNGCTNLITVAPMYAGHYCTFSYMFRNCTNLTTIELLDMKGCKSSNPTGMFEGCTNLTNLTLLNIKRTMQIGSGTSYGHLLTLDSLINTIKELWDYSSGTTTYKLTMSTTSKELIANTYVKLITATEEMIANDEYINNKLPCEVCESTDEGAMLITDYATLKKWTIA